MRDLTEEEIALAGMMGNLDPEQMFAVPGKLHGVEVVVLAMNDGAALRPVAIGVTAALYPHLELPNKPLNLTDNTPDIDK